MGSDSLIIFRQLFSTMVKHNNIVPNVHRRKHWQRNVRTYLNQATRKHRRLLARREKAAAASPRPIDKLRPAVHCQTIRYNRRQRLGRGFTLQEIKAAGLNALTARSFGISVDHRRKNRSQEGLDTNVARLKSYLSKLVVFPRNAKKVKGAQRHGVAETAQASKIATTQKLSQEPERITITAEYGTISKDMLAPLYRNEGKRNKVEKKPKKK